MMRTHNCGELKKSQVTERVKLCGWANTVRAHGGVIFIDLRDRYGLPQVLFDPSDNKAAWDIAQGIRGETCIQIEGRVTARPDDMVNPKLPTGEIEVRADQITVFNRAQTPPFPLDDEDAAKVDEELKLTYRYLDLRRVKMQRNLIQRHKIINDVRNYLDGENFLEIETPILTKSTPEGARDYLVPSRVNPGMFYALPQAPQQYKQLLMMSGMDRYFQIARCFRDEDLRADRQPEFTQIDVEMSFLTQEDIFQLIDGMLARIMRVSGHGEISLPIPRMPYAEAMNRFGSDKPDLRFGMEMVDLSEVFKATTFRVFANVLASGGVVKAINAKGLAGISLGQADEWTKIAKEAGLGGLAHIRIQSDGTWKSPITKFFSEAEKAALTERLKIENGDLLLFAADKVGVANPALGRLRLIAGAAAGVIDKSKFAFTWVTDFPLFEKDSEGQVQSMHHPFTSPYPEDMELLESDPLKIRAQAYDIVLNGTELGGGSIRIHSPDYQARIFKALGISDGEIEDRFGHLIRALGFGTPPHRHCARRGSARHADGRREFHPRCDCLPKDAEGDGPDDERAGPRGRQAAARRLSPGLHPGSQTGGSQAAAGGLKQTFTPGRTPWPGVAAALRGTVL